MTIKFIRNEKIRADFSNTGYAHLISVTPMKDNNFGSGSTGQIVCPDNELLASGVIAVHRVISLKTILNGIFSEVVS